MKEVWNSSGRQSVNMSYLTHALQYLYDELSTSSSRTLSNFQTWRQSWTLEDRSDDSPRQGNGYDCGVFTLVSIALLAQGVKLNKESYNQSIIYGLATRRQIAYLIWTSARPNGTTVPGGIVGFLYLRDPPSTYIATNPITPSPHRAKYPNQKRTITCIKEPLILSNMRPPTPFKPALKTIFSTPSARKNLYPQLVLQNLRQQKINYYGKGRSGRPHWERQLNDAAIQATSSNLLRHYLQ